MESPIKPDAGQDAVYWTTGGNASLKEINYEDAIECYKKCS